MSLFARTARHVATRRRRRPLAIAAAAVTLAPLLVAALPQPAGADLCLLAPELRDVSVSQGIGSSALRGGYEPLRRGKTTVVKGYLSKPRCAADSDRVQIRSATLEVSFPGAGPAQSLANTITGPTFPELLSYTAAPQLDAPADPVFAVPGSLLDGTERRNERVTAGFTITVNYVATRKDPTTGLDVVTDGSVTFRPSGVTAPTTTATFEKASNSLRLLVAVMGDPTKGFAANWPARTAPDKADGAEDVLLRALQAANRIAPFKDGVVRDINGTEGIRYTVAPTVVDVRSAIRTDGKFCGNADNFTYVRNQLSGFLNNWQTANRTTVVDKVLGVVWGPRSTGPATDRTCADGYASVGGNQAWTRLQPDTATAPGNAGNLIVMETIGHNFGSVPAERDDAGDGYHSVLPADAGSRGLNTVTQDPIVDAVSPLKYSLTGWNDYNTLLRREDWAYTLCRLTPGSTSFCAVDQIDPNSNTVAVGAPAGLKSLVYTLAGTTDGTAAGTDIDTYLAPDTDTSEPSTTSDFWLVQRGVSGSSEPVLASMRFPVEFTTSEHHEDGHDHSASPRGTLDVRFAAATGAQIFEVYKGDPTKTAPIYRRKRDGAPVVAATQLTPGVGELVRQTPDAGGSEPALSRDGELLSYTSATGLVVKDLVSGAVSAATTPGSASSWVDADTIAFVRSGSIYVADVTRSPAPVVGTPRLVYDSTQQAELFFAPAGRPTADPGNGSTGRHLVTAIRGDLWRIDLDSALLSPTGVTCRLAAGSLAPCYRLTTDDNVDADPAYESSDRVVFTRAAALRALTVSTGAVQPVQLAGGSQASASTPLLAYKRSGGLGLADSATLSVKAPALTSGDDSSPSLVGKRLAFARTESGKTHVFTTRLRSNTLSFSATDTNAARLRAEVYAGCGGIHYPIFVDAEPSSVNGNVAQWQLEWDGSGSVCTDPQLYAVINDGIDTVRIDFGTGIGPEQPPVGAIGALYSPAPGSTVLQYDTEPLLGDVPGVPADQLGWRVTGPGYGQDLPFRRGEPTLAFPPAGGWADQGVYTVELRRGDKVLARGTFTAIADEDHDNISKPVETRCFGPQADRDPTNASLDPDRDGEPNVGDVDPCSSSLNVAVDLDANSLNGGSNGNTVTMYLTQSKVDLRTVSQSAVAVTQVGSFEAHLPAIAFDPVSATSATVKVSRQALQDFVKSKGLTGYVPVYVTGFSTAGRFRGLDPVDPTFS